MDLVALTEFLVKSIVHNPENVSVKEFASSEDNVMLIQVLVDQEDIGRVIGKGRRVTNAVQTLVQASSYLQENKRIKIEVDNF